MQVGHWVGSIERSWCATSLSSVCESIDIDIMYNLCLSGIKVWLLNSGVMYVIVFAWSTTWKPEMRRRCMATE